MEENNEMIAIADMIVPGKKDQGETKREMDGLRPKGYAGTVGSPRMMSRTTHSGNQEFRPLTPPSGKR